MTDPRRGRSRRDFGRAVAVGTAGLLGFGSGAEAVVGVAPKAADSLLAEFVRALDVDRRGRLVLRGDDPRRGMVQNHWAVVPESIAALTDRQQGLALGLIREALTPEGFDRWTRQRDDDSGGWKHDHLAVFEAPDGWGPVEWIVTGRHLTLRGLADGSIGSGPLFWGHTATGPDSLGHGPTQAAEALLEGLTPVERRRAAVTAESSRIPGSGLPLDDLNAAGQEVARRLVASLAEPFRSLAVPAVKVALEPLGSLVGFRWQAFGPEQAPPVAWRLLGPGFRWSVHTEPHFHAWFDSA